MAGLTVAGRGLVAVTAGDAGHALWQSADSGDSWRTVVMPVGVPDTGDTAVAVAAQGDRLLLLADDAQGSRAWWMAVSEFSR
ncbi:hypothetical protein [Micromonospora deserti]|uniref:hypothetical protein n=1 Tax=Micromonospora deserti TaxID=2070366 RepID=UPI0011B45E2A|nr:hypothetical protein [Micromonospora deserti]